MDNWLNEITKSLETLEGKEVIRWVGTEMAFSEGVEPEEIWFDASVPYLQMTVLYFVTKTHEIYKVRDYQADDIFGLFIEPISKVEKWCPPEATIWRWREIAELPLGAITNTSYSLFENRLLTGVNLEIERSSLSLEAGEVEMIAEGKFKIYKEDESILIQVNGTHPAYLEQARVVD